MIPCWSFLFTFRLGCHSARSGESLASLWLSMQKAIWAMSLNIVLSVYQAQEIQNRIKPTSSGQLEILPIRIPPRQ